MSKTNTDTSTASIIEIAQEAVKPVLYSDEGLLYIPGAGGRSAAIVDLDTYDRQPTPRRKRGHIKVFDVPSLNSFIAHNRDAGCVSIYYDSNPHAPKITAVLNDHGDEDGKSPAGWRDFIVSLEFRQTPEYLRWKSIDGKLFDQVPFAEFVEENSADILDPPGAEMLEIVTFLQATRDTSFKSAINLSNGQVQFTNIENIQASVRAGEVSVPTTFTLGIAPVQGSRRYKIETKLRYRLAGGQLKLGIKLLRLEDIMAEVFSGAIEDIVRFEGLVLVEGSPFTD